jgi:DNA-binding transcriptional LysR family regulator
MGSSSCYDRECPCPPGHTRPSFPFMQKSLPYPAKMWDMFSSGGRRPECQGCLRLPESWSEHRLPFGCPPESRMDELASIKSFVEVIDSGGFSAAARRANVSVSSMARQVKALEDHLGTRLLNRTTRSQSLTEAGRLFYDRVRELVRELDAAKKDVQSFQKDVKGLLRVTLRVSSASIILPALPSFLERHPDLTLDLSLTDERLDLVANGIDVAVWLGHLADSGLVARRLCPSWRVVCGSPAYFTRHGTPKKPIDLANHNCLVFKANRYGNVWKFTNGNEQVDVLVNGNIRSETGQVLLSGALSGLGLVLLQEYMVRSALAAGTLRTVLTEYDVSPTEGDTALYAVYPHSRGMSRNTRAFIDFLVALFRERKPANQPPSPSPNDEPVLGPPSQFSARVGADNN